MLNNENFDYDVMSGNNGNGENFSPFQPKKRKLDINEIERINNLYKIYAKKGGTITQYSGQKKRNVLYYDLTPENIKKYSFFDNEDKFMNFTSKINYIFYTPFC